MTLLFIMRLLTFAIRHKVGGYFPRYLRSCPVLATCAQNRFQLHQRETRGSSEFPNRFLSSLSGWISLALGGGDTMADMDSGLPRWPFPQAAVAVILTAGLLYVAVNTWRGRRNSNSQPVNSTKNEHLDVTKDIQRAGKTSTAALYGTRNTFSLVSVMKNVPKNPNLECCKNTESSFLTNLCAPLFTHNWNDSAVLNESYARMWDVKDASNNDTKSKNEFKRISSVDCRNKIPDLYSREKSIKEHRVAHHNDLNELKRRVQRGVLCSPRATLDDREDIVSPKQNYKLKVWSNTPKETYSCNSSASVELHQSEFEDSSIYKNPGSYHSSASASPLKFPQGLDELRECNKNDHQQSHVKDHNPAKELDADFFQAGIQTPFKISQIRVSKILNDKSMFREMLRQGSQMHYIQNINSRLLKSMFENLGDDQSIENPKSLSDFLASTYNYTSKAQESSLFQDEEDPELNNMFWNLDSEPKISSNEEIKCECFEKYPTLTDKNNSDKTTREETFIDMELISETQLRNESPSKKYIGERRIQMDQTEYSESMQLKYSKSVPTHDTRSKSTHFVQENYTKLMSSNEKCCKTKCPSNDLHLTSDIDAGFSSINWESLGKQDRKEIKEARKDIKIIQCTEQSRHPVSPNFNVMHSDAKDHDYPKESQSEKGKNKNLSISKNIESPFLGLIREKIVEDNSSVKSIKKANKTSQTPNSNRLAYHIGMEFCKLLEHFQSLPQTTFREMDYVGPWSMSFPRTIENMKNEILKGINDDASRNRKRPPSLKKKSSDGVKARLKVGRIARQAKHPWSRSITREREDLTAKYSLPKTKKPLCGRVGGWSLWRRIVGRGIVVREGFSQLKRDRSAVNGGRAETNKKVLPIVTDVTSSALSSAREKSAEHDGIAGQGSEDEIWGRDVQLRVPPVSGASRHQMVIVNVVAGRSNDSSCTKHEGTPPGPEVPAETSVGSLQSEDSVHSGGVDHSKQRTPVSTRQNKCDAILPQTSSSSDLLVGVKALDCCSPEAEIASAKLSTRLERAEIEFAAHPSDETTVCQRVPTGVPYPTRERGNCVHVTGQPADISQDSISRLPIGPQDSDTGKQTSNCSVNIGNSPRGESRSSYGNVHVNLPGHQTYRGEEDLFDSHVYRPSEFERFNSHAKKKVWVADAKFGSPVFEAAEILKLYASRVNCDFLNKDHLDLNAEGDNCDTELSISESENNAQEIALDSQCTHSHPTRNELELKDKYFESDLAPTTAEKNSLGHGDELAYVVKDLLFSDVTYDCELSGALNVNYFTPVGGNENVCLSSEKHSLEKLQNKSRPQEERLNCIDVIKPEELRNSLEIFAAKVKGDFDQLTNNLLRSYEAISEKLYENLNSEEKHSTEVPRFDDPKDNRGRDNYIVFNNLNMENSDSFSDDSDRAEETSSIRRLRLLGLLHRNRERQARLGYLTEITDSGEHQDEKEINEDPVGANNFSFYPETVRAKNVFFYENEILLSDRGKCTKGIPDKIGFISMNDFGCQEVGVGKLDKEINTGKCGEEEDSSEASLRAIDQAIGHMQRIISNEDHPESAQDFKDDSCPITDVAPSNAEDWDALMRDVLSNVSSLEEWMREREKECDGEKKGESLGQEPSSDTPVVTAGWRDKSMRREPEEFAESSESATKSYLLRDEKRFSNFSVMDAGEVATAAGENPPPVMESPEKPAKVKNLRFKLDPDIYDFQSENGYEDYYYCDEATERPGGRWKTRPTWCKPQQKYHTFSSLDLGRNREPVKVVSVRTSVVPAGHKMVARPIGVNYAEGQRSPEKYADSSLHDGEGSPSTETQVKLKQLDIDLRIRLETENGVQSSYSDVTLEECRCSPDRKSKRVHLENSPSRPKRKSPVVGKKEGSPDIVDFKGIWNSTSITSTKEVKHSISVPDNLKNFEVREGSPNFDTFKESVKQQQNGSVEPKGNSPVTLSRSSSDLNCASENDANFESVTQNIGPISTTPSRPDTLLPPSRPPRRPLYIPRKKFVPDPEAIERITAYKIASGSKPPLPPPPPLTSYRLSSGVKNRTDSARKRYLDSKSHLFAKNTDGSSKFEQFLIEAQQDRVRLMTSTPDLDIIEMAVRNKWSRERKSSCSDLSHSQQSTPKVVSSDGVRSSTPDDVWMSYVQKLRRKFNRRSRSLGYLETDLDACLAEEKACSMLALEPCPPERNRSLTPGPFASKSEHNIVRLSEMGRTKSEHELRVEKSLQNLNLPDWYRNSDRPKTGFLLSRKPGERRGWAAVKSLTSSTTSLASDRSRRPVRSLRTSQENLTWSRGSASPCSTEGSISRGNAPSLSLALARAFREPYLGWRARTPSSCASPSPQPDFSPFTWGGMDHTERSDTPLTSDLPVMDEEVADCFDETSGEISCLDVNGMSPPESIAGEDTCDDLKNMSMDTFELHAPVTNGHHEITTSQEYGDTGNDIKDITMDSVETCDLINEEDDKINVPAREDTYDDIKKISMDTFELLEPSLDVSTSEMISSTGADTCTEASGREAKLTNGHHDTSPSALAHDNTCDDVNNISTDTSENPRQEVDGEALPRKDERTEVDFVSKGIQDIPGKCERVLREKTPLDDAKRKRFSYNQSIYHSELWDENQELNGEEKALADLEGSSQSLTSGSSGSNKVIWIESSFVGSRTTTSIVVLPVEKENSKDSCYSNQGISGSNPSVERPASR